MQLALLLSWQPQPHARILTVRCRPGVSGRGHMVAERFAMHGYGGGKQPGYVQALTAVDGQMQLAKAQSKL